MKKLKLFVINLFRRLRGKHEISDLVFDERFYTTRDLFLKIAGRSGECLLICFDASDDIEKRNAKIFANIAEDSVLIRSLPDVVVKLIEANDRSKQ